MKGVKMHFVSASCGGEACRMCKDIRPATHKIGEEILQDDPIRARHNYTAYVCCEHFETALGKLAHEQLKRLYAMSVKNFKPERLSAQLSLGSGNDDGKN